jgi:hypothetical protein
VLPNQKIKARDDETEGKAIEMPIRLRTCDQQEETKDITKKMQ